MAQYFFHVRRRNVIYEDLKGADLPSLAIAHERAAEDIREIIDQDMVDGPISGYWLEIGDASGTAVAAMPFTDAH